MSVVQPQATNAAGAVGPVGAARATVRAERARQDLADLERLRVFVSSRRGEIAAAGQDTTQADALLTRLLEGLVFARQLLPG